MHQFATDIFGVKQLGIEAWQKDYAWPVGWREFLAFTDAQWDHVDGALGGLEANDRDLFLLTIGFVGQAREVLHGAAVRRHVTAEGRALLVTPLSRRYYEPDWSAEADVLASVRNAQMWRLRVRAAARRALDPPRRGIGQRLSSLAGRSAVWSVGTSGGLKERWIARDGRSAVPVYAATLLGSDAGGGGGKLSSRLDDAIASLTADFSRDAAQLMGVSADLSEFGQAWKTAAGRVSAALDGLARRIRKPPKVLIANEVASLPHRILATALGRKGTRTIACAHGNEVVHVVQRHAAYFLYPAYDEYLCETDAAAAGNRDQYETSALSRLRPVDFTSIETNAFDAMHARAVVPVPSPRPRVMLIGYPHNASRSQYDVTDFFAFHLFLEVRLAEFLKDCGCQVIYKTHPDRRREAEGIFEGRVDEVVVTPFEQVLDSADVYLFTSTITSTFGVAVCTKRPVVVLDVDGKRWNPRFFSHFEQRCRLVPAGLDDANRFWFDAEKLRAAVRLPGAEPDFNIVRAIYSPRES